MVDHRLILRGADGYDEARFARVFNVRRPERYPAAVLVAESEDDIVEGVRLARDRGWKVAIRAGSHSFPAWSLSGTRGRVFFDFSLPRNGVPDMAMSLRDVMLGSYIIYEEEQNDKAYSAWHLEAMKALEPFTVGQYWGDSDQTRRGENSDRRRMGASAADPYAARPERPVRRLPRRSGFRNHNGWETNQ